MATTFKITQLPTRASLNINGAPAVLNQQYDIALESTITIVNTTGFKAEPLDVFKYKIIKDDIESSNIGTVQINFETDKETSPDVIEASEIINIGSQFFFSDVIYSQNNYDRILVTEISGKGSWLLNGTPITTGSVIFYYELKDALYFVANDPGYKNYYNVFKYKPATILGPVFNENIIWVHTVSKASISNDGDTLDAEDNTTYETYSKNIPVSGGSENGTFEFSIDTTEFLNIGVDPENSVKIFASGTELATLTTATTVNFSGALSEDGTGLITLEMTRKKPSVVENTVSVILLSIDNDTSKVESASSTIDVIIPITTI